MTDYTFFLGGRDLEMRTIRRLLEEHAPGRVHDRDLGWGAKASAYREEIEACLERGETPVLVELEDDLALDSERVVRVDHHGERAGASQASALEQVFELLGLPPEKWTRELELVAANDIGHVAEMVRRGASVEEMRRIRAADRAAQGITEEQEQQAEEAAKAVEVLCGGRLHVARQAHGKTSALVDRLTAELGGPGFENLVVVSPPEVNFFGVGRLVRRLDSIFPGGWYGGALPERGFWVSTRADGGEVVEALVRELSG